MKIAGRRSAEPDHARPDHAKPEMTPMIDVTFLLLIFFMLTIQFRTLEGVMKARLPRDVGPNPGAMEPQEKIHVRIDVLRPGTVVAPGGGRWSGVGPFVFDDTRVVQWSVGPWKTRDAGALAHRLRELRRLEPERDAVIDARPGTICADAVTALDAARLAGWSTISFAAAR